MSSLIAIAGQSNAGGFGLNSGSVPTALKGWTTPQVQIWNPTTQAFEQMVAGTNTGTVNQPTMWGPELGFAHEWVADHPGETLYIVKTIKGSTDIAADPTQLDWSPTSGELFATMTAQLNAAKAAAGIGQVSGIFWMLGEQAAVEGSKAAAHATLLTDEFAAMRASWGDAGTPIVFGQISDKAGLEFMGQVRAAQAAVDAADGNAVSVNTDSFGMQADKLHYSGDGQVSLGTAMYEAWTTAPRWFSGTAGQDTVTGADASDYLHAGEGDDLVFGGAAWDDLHGNQGDDTVVGGLGDDWVVGGQGRDVLYGEQGADIVLGNIGNDSLDGGLGNDTMRGGQDSDLLVGGQGDDWLSGDDGADTIIGGAGADTFNFFAEAGTDRVMDFNRAEGDRVQLDPGTVFTVTHQGADTLVTTAGGDVMTLVGVTLQNGDWIFGY